MLTRFALGSLLSVVLLAFAPPLAAQDGCDNCFDGECFTGGGTGVAMCEQLDGACWVGGDCCVESECDGGGGGRYALLDGSRRPLDAGAGEVASTFVRGGAVLLRLCQGDVVYRRYDHERMDQIRRSTATLTL